ncbi:hypothetical protein TcasGA2_TC008843 [Tribolium castaneum]|uniref:Uncharacterized protein n=1 Tax=Tribolium castaneum TaxID=7070 RepID=D6WR36_TRICA|nr:hypothetical protein TcasGA2_TC008843 [Tribolium castaneum]
MQSTGQADQGDLAGPGTSTKDDTSSLRENQTKISSFSLRIFQVIVSEPKALAPNVDCITPIQEVSYLIMVVYVLLDAAEFRPTVVSLARRIIKSPSAMHPSEESSSRQNSTLTPREHCNIS